MKALSHLSFDTAASASDRYFGSAYFATQYAVQMMQPGRIIGFRCYGATLGERAIVQNVTPIYFASGDRISVYIRCIGGEQTNVEIRKNGALATGWEDIVDPAGDSRNQAWNATILVEYL